MLSGRPNYKPDGEWQAFANGYLDCGSRPLFFFGEGLSYTNFEYESMILDTHELTESGKINVTVKLRNAGERDGKEVVQLYMHDKVSSAVRPVQELLAFKKVFLKAGESTDVQFEIREPALRFWNAQNQLISEAGDFELFVGYADHRYISDEFTLVK
jgi:beta-glucosidase